MTETMQDSGVEWIGEIPQGWEVVRVKDVLNFYNTQRIPLSAADRGLMIDKEFDYYGASGVIDKVDNYIFDGTYTLVAEDGANLLSRNTPLAFIAEGQFWVNNHAHILKPRFGNIVFFTRFLESMDYSLFVTGAAQPKLTKENLGKFKILNPPIPEQQAIAQYLDERCGKLDSIITIKKQQIQTLDALRQSIIYQAVTKGLDDCVELVDSGVEWLGEIPKGWKVRKLKYITKQIVDGTHFTPTYVETGVPFLRVTDIQTESIDFESIKFIPVEEHVELTKRAKPEKGDILLSKNGTIGITKVVEWDWEFSIFVSLCLIKLLPIVSPYYFSYFFESDVVNQQISESSKKTSVTNLHLVKIRELLFCFPSLSDQQKIVNYLDDETQRLAQLKANLTQQINVLLDYKKSLIYECVTGKKRVFKAG